MSASARLEVVHEWFEVVGGRLAGAGEREVGADSVIRARGSVAQRA
jgi:hypothetical protein